MRYYSSIATPGALAAPIDGNATSIQVSNAVGWPSSKPHTAVIDPDTTLEEIVTVTATAGSTWTVIRGEDGTAKIPHASGAVVKHMISARDMREAQEHIDASTGVHGVTSGNVVGTSQSQTLTNKTISGAANTVTSLPQTAVTGLTTHVAAFDSHVADTNVHGVTSGVMVGTSQSQTLTNKTISGNDNTISSISQAMLTSALSDKIAKTDGILDIACGVATNVNTDSLGGATVTHNAGFEPTVMFFAPVLDTAGLIVTTRLGGTMNSTAVHIRAFSTATGEAVDTTITTLFWVAIRSA